MGQKLISLAVIVAGGVMLADLVTHSTGTTALFNGLGGLWATSVQGMLGNTTTAGRKSTVA